MNTVKNKQKTAESLQQFECKTEDINLLSTIYKICEKGCDVEVRKSKDGSFKVYEVKKKIAS